MSKKKMVIKGLALLACVYMLAPFTSLAQDTCESNYDYDYNLDSWEMLLSLGLDEGDWAQEEPASDYCIDTCADTYPDTSDFFAEWRCWTKCNRCEQLGLTVCIEEGGVLDRVGCGCGGECCAANQHCCKTESNAFCCSSLEVCCEDRCCPLLTRCCGDECCPPLTKCCEGLTEKYCCGVLMDCCLGGCCKPGETCCIGAEKCCERGEECCEDKCCERGEVCCNGIDCCSPNRCAANDGCCLDDETPCGQSGDIRTECCSPEEQCFEWSSNGAIEGKCCPADEVLCGMGSSESECCPPDKCKDGKCEGEECPRGEKRCGDECCYPELCKDIINPDGDKQYMCCSFDDQKLCGPSSYLDPGSEYYDYKCCTSDECCFLGTNIFGNRGYGCVNDEYYYCCPQGIMYCPNETYCCPGDQELKPGSVACCYPHEMCCQYDELGENGRPFCCDPADGPCNIDLCL